MSLQELQQQWNTLYRTTLPTLAKEHHSTKSGATPSQRWPVSLDHCFARIILDNAVGVDKPWTEVVKAPASKNMTVEQLERALEMGEEIKEGRADLWELDERSLRLRGKQTKGTKRKREGEESKVKPEPSAEERTVNEKPLDDNQESKENALPQTMSGQGAPPPEKKTRKQEMTDIWRSFSPSSPASKTKQEDDASLLEARKLIASDASLKPFRKHVLTLLTQVPKGRYTTYQALSDAAVRLDAKRKGKGKDENARGSARAIGGAMRNNPFAPTVPCHRVLASSGMLGGFGGSWGEDGEFAGEKKRLLREEGVRFDGKGRVVGEPFRDFWAYA